MKYSSDNLSDFEFHDAELSFVSFSDNTLTVSAEMLNIHKETKQNPHPADMEIDRALITFHNFTLHSFDPGDTWTRDSNEEWFPSEKGEVLLGTHALEKFLHELQTWICVYRFDTAKDGGHSIEAASSDEPWFEVVISFSRVIIEWDKYRRMAWYEEKRQKSSQ